MKQFTRVFPLALLLGIVLTALFTAQMNWRPNSSCIDFPNKDLPGNIARIDCAGLEYGYPRRFIYAKPSVSPAVLPQNNKSPAALIGVSSVIKLDKLALFMDLAIWTGVSYGALLLISSAKRKKQ